MNCSHTTNCATCAPIVAHLTAQRDAAEAREREIGEELDKATGMVEMHVGDAEAARLLWRSSEKACAHMDAQRIAARADRDAAQQMVAELRAVLRVGRDIVIETSSRHTQWVEGAYDAIEASAPIANRWCLASERDEALRLLATRVEAVRLDAAIARAEKAEARIQRTEAVTNGALDAVIARLDSFESNVVAQEARLKLATETIEKLFAAAMAGPTGDSVADAEDAKNAWDAVQGDDKGQP